MKREIKFRALVPVNSDEPKTMQYFDLSEIDDLNQLAAADWDINQLMQFTGLKDKHGKEIYEGDIRTGNYFKSVIEFDQTSGGWVMSVINSTVKYRLTAERAIESEVIGNIYQNPELLK